MKHFFRTKVFASVVLMSSGLMAQEAAPPQSAGTVAAQSESQASQNKTSENKTSESKASQAPSADLTLTRSITSEGAQPGDSHVRIVRLSEVRGKVVLDRNVGRGPEATLQNMPIAQGMAMATGSDGYAEVEFEDGSALRLAPNSEVRFPLLVLRSTGVKASTVLVDRGTVYVDQQKSKDTELTLAMGKARISVAPGTHLRLDMTGAKAELAVISGMATVQAGEGAGAVVAKKQTMTLDAVGSGPTEVAKGIYESPYDGWDSDASKYHARYMRTSQNMGSTALYGMSDLNYYGSFVNGCGGSFWQPYMVSASWSPYSQGMWALYSTGYSWVSPYPWGWLPFHTGAWSYCSGVGWGWNPGGSWYGLQNVAMMNPVGGVAVSGSYGIARAPNAVALPRPPHGSQSMVVQSSGEMVRSTMDRPDNFVFRRDSAGMGVPRGSLGGLHGISRDVERHGFANREVFADTMAPARSMMARGDHSGTAASTQVNLPTTLRRGPAPEGFAQGNDRFAWKNGGPNAAGAQQQGQNSMRPANNAQSGGSRPSSASNGGASQGSFNRGGNFGGGQAGGSFNRGGGTPSGGNAGGGRGSAPAGAAPH